METHLVSRSRCEPPTVSVLMAVYNERRCFLEQSIESILDQTFTDFEFIIVDDGSDKADTILTLDRFAKRDPRIRVERNSHYGLTKSLNLGLSLCRGEFICRQDSDDWSETTRVMKQIDFLRRNPLFGVVGSYIRLHQEEGAKLWDAKFPTTPEAVEKALQACNPFCHGAVCFRRKDAEAIGGYREELTCSQDYDFFWRLCEPSRGANLPEVLYHHRFTHRSLSTRKADEQAKAESMTKLLAEMRRNKQEEDVQLAYQEAMKRVDQDKLNYGGWLRCADYLMLSGRYRQALGGYIRAVLTNPMQVSGWLKLVRLVLFATVPPARERLFSSRPL